MGRQHISSGSEFERSIGYSRAVVDDDFVFVSGTTGYDYATMTIADDVVEQARQCMHNIRSALSEAGTDLRAVVMVRYIFPERADFEPCWPVFKEHFGSVAPAATMIVAGLFDPAMKLEVEVIARK